MIRMNPTLNVVKPEAPPNADAMKKSEKHSSRPFRRGQWVEIRTEEEIRATLDAEGKLEGLPFMPEQVKYCGLRYPIYRRADRVFLDHHFYMVRLKSTVLLDDLRCDGSAHGGCQMRCLMFWKEAWLHPSTRPAEEDRIPPPVSLLSLTPLSNGKAKSCEPNMAETTTEPKAPEIFTCQATEMVRIGKRLRGWDLRQYIGEALNGERGLVEILKVILTQVRFKIGRVFSRKNKLAPITKAAKPPGDPLNLQSGDWVEVKALADIDDTLNSDNRLRGLSFSPDMIPFCGKRFRVKGRVERMILEWTGELKQLRDTVELEMSHCDGRSCHACPRNCFFLWREAWLIRAEPPAESPE